MRDSALQTLAVATILVIAGCAGVPQTTETETTITTSPSSSPPQQSTTASTESGNATTALESLPAVETCTDVGVPHPNKTDGLDPSTYPEPPTTINATTTGTYIAHFEMAYLRNTILAEAGADQEMNLAHASTQARPIKVVKRDGGYGVHLRVSAGTRYEDGTTGDRWPSIGYFVNETVLVRGTVEAKSDQVTPESGTVVLRCK